MKHCEKDKILITLECGDNENLNYNSIFIKNKQSVKKFNTGNIIIDWLDCLYYVFKNYMEKTIIIFSDNILNYIQKHNNSFKLVYLKENEILMTNNNDYDYFIIVNDQLKTKNDIVLYYNQYYRNLKLNFILN